MRNILSLPLNKASTILMAAYTLLWGIWLASPFWDVFTRAPLYSALSAVFPEYAWGIIAILCGLATTWGVLHQSARSLAIGAYVGFIHWLVISGGYFIGDWQNTGGITALTIALYSALIYLNLRVNRDNLPLEEKHVKI